MSEGVIDVSKPRGAVLEDLASDIRVIPVGEDTSFLLGNIMDLKSYGQFLFLHDDGSRKISCVQEDGRFLYALDALGRAEHEYLDIGTYTFDSARLSLVIFERSRQELKWYTGPDAVYTSSHRLGFEVSAMEWLEGSRYVLVRGSSRVAASRPSLLLYDVATDSVLAELPLREDQAEMITDMAFSRTGAGRETYVCVPGLVNRVYRADSAGFTAAMEIAMTPNKLGEEYWSGDFDDAKEREGLAVLQNGEGGIAMLPSFFIKTGKAVSFYYLPGGEVFWHNLPAMNLCLLRDGKTWVVDRLTLRGTKTALAPLGVHDGRYVALVETALLEASGDPGPTALKIRDFAEAGIEHVLVEYGF